MQVSGNKNGVGLQIKFSQLLMFLQRSHRNRRLCMTEESILSKVEKYVWSVSILAMEKQGTCPLLHLWFENISVFIYPVESWWCNWCTMSMLIIYLTFALHVSVLETPGIGLISIKIPTKTQASLYIPLQERDGCHYTGDAGKWILQNDKVMPSTQQTIPHYPSVPWRWWLVLDLSESNVRNRDVAALKDSHRWNSWCLDARPGWP